MKLVEKLGMEWARYFEPKRAPASLEEIRKVDEWRTMVNAYEAGFRKAREMAADECKAEALSSLKKAYTFKVDGFITHWLAKRAHDKALRMYSTPLAKLSYRVRMIGEEEV